MAPHPVRFADEALADLVRQLEDPDEQDALVDALDEALSHFPRRHPTARFLGPQARVRRDGRWSVVFDVADTDPALAEGEASLGAMVVVRHVWRQQGQDLESLLREHLSQT